jgi:hypothetical protein
MVIVSSAAAFSRSLTTSPAAEMSCLSFALVAGEMRDPQTVPVGLIGESGPIAGLGQQLAQRPHGGPMGVVTHVFARRLPPVSVGGNVFGRRDGQLVDRYGKAAPIRFVGRPGCGDRPEVGESQPASERHEGAEQQILDGRSPRHQDPHRVGPQGWRHGPLYPLRRFHLATCTCTPSTQFRHLNTPPSTDQPTSPQRCRQAGSLTAIQAVSARLSDGPAGSQPW